MAATTAAVAVAYSGGRDSTVLLHATLAAVRGTGLGVLALHVHHGLSAHADAWLAHCEARCARWAAEGAALEFDSRRVAGRPARGQSIEAWAREVRYAALADMALARGVDLVLLGHHRRDQAETVLLQALRGAGSAGLAAMPRSAHRSGITWARPWLDETPQRIERYARAHGLAWVEDDSNVDRRLRRNRLRHAVWPALEGAFPDAEGALAAVAEHAAEALACAAELAAIDLAAVARPDAGLGIDAWAALSAARRSNVLRAWLPRETGSAVQASLVARLLDELAAGDAPACWPAPGGFVLRRYRGVLHCLPRRDEPGQGGAAGGEEAGGAVEVAADPCTDEHAKADLPRMAGRPREAGLPGLRASTAEAPPHAGVVHLPGWGGRLRWAPVAAGGLPPESLGALRLVPRAGGERFQLAPGRPPRSLRKQFQALGVPAWRREGPLVWLGDALVYVPGLGHDARTWAPAGAPQVGLAWQADPPAEGAAAGQD